MESLQVIKPDISFLAVGKPDIGPLEEQAVLQVLRSGWLGNGPVAKKFEDLFSTYLGRDLHAVATSSCTAGLMMALRACMVGEGDEVITTPLTFAATVNAILHVGAKPVFVDVDVNGCLNANQVFKAITKKTKAILPVHLAGSPCDMGFIMELADRHDLDVIEDAAHAFGGHCNGRALGTIGDFGVFSFYPTKNLASGDGGMVIAKSKAQADTVRVLASQGLSEGAWGRYGSGPVKNYEVDVVGYKGLMSDVHAAIAHAQLYRWPELEANRARVWDVYAIAFGDKPIGHSKHLFTIHVDNRDKLRAKLAELRIGTGIHYNPLHLEPAYSFLNYKRGDFPMAEDMGRTTLSLPLSPTMTREDAGRVVEAVKKYGEGEY